MHVSIDLNGTNGKPFGAVSQERASCRELNDESGSLSCPAMPNGFHLLTQVDRFLGVNGRWKTTPCRPDAGEVGEEQKAQAAPRNPRSEGFSIFGTDLNIPVGLGRSFTWLMTKQPWRPVWPKRDR